MIIRIMICPTKYSNSIFPKMKRHMKNILFYIFFLLFRKESNRLYMQFGRALYNSIVNYKININQNSGLTDKKIRRKILWFAKLLREKEKAHGGRNAVQISLVKKADVMWNGFSSDRKEKTREIFALRWRQGNESVSFPKVHRVSLSLSRRKTNGHSTQVPKNELSLRHKKARVKRLERN